MSERVTTARARELSNTAITGCADAACWRHPCAACKESATRPTRLRDAAPDLAADLLDAREELRLTTPAVDAVRGVIAALCLAPDATYTEVVAAVEERAGMLAHAVQSWKARASGMEAAEREIARLRRQMEHATPWQVSEVPTDEEMRALRMRWAFGPEKYQADADSLIAAVIHSREEIARLRAELVAARTESSLLFDITRGRLTPPDGATMEALDAAGGCWLVSYDDDETGDPVVTIEYLAGARDLAKRVTDGGNPARWIAVDRFGHGVAPREPAADVARDAPGVG